MATAYVDLNTIHNPATGLVIPSAWGDQIRENFEALVDPPRCSVFATVAQSVAASTSVVLNAGGENYDTDGMHSTVTNTSRITAQKAARYELAATVAYDPGNGRRITSFLVGGVTTLNGDARASAGQAGLAGITDRISIVRSVVLAAGQYVEVQVNQNTAGALNVTLDEFVVTWTGR